MLRSLINRKVLFIRKSDKLRPLQREIARRLLPAVPVDRPSRIIRTREAKYP